MLQSIAFPEEPEAIKFVLVLAADVPVSLQRLLDSKCTLLQLTSRYRSDFKKNLIKTHTIKSQEIIEMYNYISRYIVELIDTNKYCSDRQLFYKHVAMFKTQGRMHTVTYN